MVIEIDENQTIINRATKNFQVKTIFFSNDDKKIDNQKFSITQFIDRKIGQLKKFSHQNLFNQKNKLLKEMSTSIPDK